MIHEFKLTVITAGEYEEEELQEYLEYIIGADGGSCSSNNPFYQDDGIAEVRNINLEIQ